MEPGTCRYLLYYTVIFTGCIIVQCMSPPNVFIQFILLNVHWFLMSTEAPEGSIGAANGKRFSTVDSLSNPNSLDEADFLLWG